MKIVDIDEIDSYKEEVSIALGNFDGVHLAHQTLIKDMVLEAKKKGTKSSILIFETHTKEVIGGKKPKLLTSKEQKYKILKDLGVDIIFIMEFNPAIMTLKPEEFVQSILVDKIDVKTIHVGFDYSFGYRASGNSSLLREIAEKYNIEVFILDPIKDGQIISSTLIRDYIIKGNIKEANRLLGRNYSILGKVVPGEKRGRKLGFPTANIYIDDNYLLPKEGIYSTNTILAGEKYLSGTNIGKNLTFNGDHIKVENFIIDFDEFIYGEYLEIEFNEYIRDEIKFESPDSLIKQIKKDVDYIRRSR